jgi:hypothetical protein
MENNRKIIEVKTGDIPEKYRRESNTHKSFQPLKAVNCETISSFSFTENG